jgi:GT2 family glycosyltransferase
MQADQTLIGEWEAPAPGAPEAAPERRVVAVVLEAADPSRSAVAAALRHLGGELVPAIPSPQPGRPPSGNKTNALGELNDEILAAVGSSPDDILPISSERLRDGGLAELRERATCLVASDSLEDRPVLVLADPRLCRLVPFWADVIEASRADARFALVVRDPASAIASQRGGATLPEQLAKLLWLRNAIDAERETRGRERCLVVHEWILSDWRQCMGRLRERLALPLPAPTEDAREKVDALVERQARQAAVPLAAADSPELDRWIRRAHDALLEAADRDPEPAPAATLDAIARELDDRLRIAEPALRAQQARSRTLENRLAAVRRQSRRLRLERAQRHHAAAAREAMLLELIGSTSWRLTAPLRALTRTAQRLRRRWSRARRSRALSGGDFPPADDARYRAWVERHDTLDDAARAGYRERLARTTRNPLISIVMATYETQEGHLRAALDSARAQLYPNWELCVADDASASPHVRRLLDEAARSDDRIKVAYRERNGHISAASNTALALASGEFVAFLDHDDLLAENALAEVALELDRRPDAEFLYSDEDRLDTRGRRCEPYFKPDWNPELLLGNNYLCHLAVARRALVERVGGFREGFEGSQDYDLFLRIIRQVEDPRRIRHIARVLYHWRKAPGSTAALVTSKPYAAIAGRRALSDHLAGDGVVVEHGTVPTFYRVRYPLPDPPPPVSLIIPTRDGGDYLIACVESILTATEYPDYELIVVDNGSRERATVEFLAEFGKRERCRVLSYEREFNFSAINNMAARQAAGEVLGFVNDDIEVQTPDWLEEMVSYVVRPEVGAVGAKLLYPNGRIQHGGIALGIGGVAGHMHKGWPGDDPGYFGRLICPQAVSAVTAACMLIARSKFEEADGFEQESLTIAFNDIDLCLRIREAGYRNVWTPYAVLWHAESASRGYEDTEDKRQRFETETAYMKHRWGSVLVNDPYYNPNLTLRSEGLEVAGTPRI